MISLALGQYSQIFLTLWVPQYFDVSWVFISYLEACCMNSKMILEIINIQGYFEEIISKWHMALLGGEWTISSVSNLYYIPLGVWHVKSPATGLLVCSDSQQGKHQSSTVLTLCDWKSTNHRWILPSWSASNVESVFISCHHDWLTQDIPSRNTASLGH